MKKFFITLIILILLIPCIFADFEMTIPLTGNPAAMGPLTILNRQTTYYWNNDTYEIVAMGFSTTSTITNPTDSSLFTLGTDIDGLRQYRIQIAKQEITTDPNETAIRLPGAADISMNLSGDAKYPRYPHIVVRAKPCYALKYPDTTIYAPPLSYTDIDSATGAVIGQADYYSAAAWYARDTAPLFVETTGATRQHPTQIWIGRPDMTPGSIAEDAVNPIDYNGWYSMRVTASVGYRFAPNNPSGQGVNYTHTSGSGPGGLMWAMAAAFGQEIFGYDLRLMFAIGSQECGIGLFYDGSGGFPNWQWAGDACANGTGDGEYQMIDADMKMAIMSFPDYYPHPNSYANDPAIPAGIRGNIIRATITMLLDISTRYYGYFSASRALKIDEFTDQLKAAGGDPYALVKLISYGYNRGPHDNGVQQFRCGLSARTNAISTAAKNISKAPYNVEGASGYTPHVVDLMRRIGRTNDVYDWAITWGDVTDFLNDLRTMHYANGIPTAAQWTAMTNELQLAFQRMQGKVPAGQQPPSYNANTISFRYNWLTLLRIMKKYLPNPHLYMPKGWNYNDVDFLDPYRPTLANEETYPQVCGSVNYAPEIYWITPRHKMPTTEQAFPVIPDICNNTPLAITADVLDDNVGGGGLTVRYAISPGDPSAGGYSLWRDGEATGGTIANPVPSDWTAMSDIGASTNPAGGRKFRATINPTGITGVRRIYIEANDNCGYRTISWVDVSFVDCSSFTPTPTPCTPNLTLPKGHDPINCFPDSSSISSISAGSSVSLSWETNQNNTYDSVGALKITITGSKWSGYLISIPVNEGNLTGYNRLCIKIWNQTGITLTMHLGAGITDPYTPNISTGSINIPTTSGYQEYCWDLQNQSSATRVTLAFDSFPPVPPGIIFMDDIQLRTTSGSYEKDPRCCPPPMTPTPTFTATRTNTPTSTRTNTSTNTNTFTATITNTFTATPTNTLTNTRTNTPTNTAINTFTNILTNTPTNTITNTPTNTFTNTPTNTRTNTSTNTITNTPTNTITSTQTNTITNTFTLTFTRTNTSTPSFTASPTETATRTSTPTETWTGTQPPTWTPTNTFTDTVTRTSTPTFTITNSSTPTHTASFTGTATETASATATRTATNTATATNTITSSFTNTVTGTPPPTWTSTNTRTDTPSPTVTSTPSYTLTSTSTNTVTNTRTATDTATATATRTATNTSTATATYTASYTITSTRTATATYTITATPTETPTARPSPVTLKVELSAGGDEPALGSKVTYTIKIKNEDVKSAYNIGIWDSLPDNLRFIESIGTTATVNGNYINWDLTGSEIKPGEYLVIKFVVEIVKINKEFPITNKVYVDYNDEYYAAPERHPAIESNTAYYPSELPVVYPNPFNPAKAVGGVLKIDNLVPGSTVRIYTVSGEIVASIMAGSNIKVVWDGKNRYGKEVSSGIYLYVIKNAKKDYFGKIFVIR